MTYGWVELGLKMPVGPACLLRANLAYALVHADEKMAV